MCRSPRRSPRRSRSLAAALGPSCAPHALQPPTALAPSLAAMAPEPQPMPAALNALVPTASGTIIVADGMPFVLVPLGGPGDALPQAV